MRQEIISLNDLIEAGYTADEVRGWGVPERYAGEMYYWAGDLKPWLGEVTDAADE